MHYLDPDRPRLHADGGLPLLQGPHKGRIVLPGLHVAPRGTPDAATMEISIFLPMPSGGASRREITLSPHEFLAFWVRWLADPERVAQEEFGWVARPQSMAPVIDLDDLLEGVL